MKTHSLEVQSFIDNEHFSPYQWIVLILCFSVVAADGFDTAAVGFIAPSLVGEWGIPRAALGPVMSAALIGLGIGALAAGPAADRIGRKAVLGVVGVLLRGVESCVGARGFHRIAHGLALSDRARTGPKRHCRLPAPVPPTTHRRTH